MNDLLYTFYGDDFTGSTDVLEQLALGGVRSALFFAPPGPEDLARLPGLQAVGVAGDSRSRSPEWMSAELPRIFRRLRALGAPVAHYKVCSTFDSSPRVGSIGRALELGLEAFEAVAAPLIVGAPYLGRFVWNGMLFAADPLGAVHRIDRHPMRRHPVTPMREPRLMEHLRAQTALDVRALCTTGDAEELAARMRGLERDGARAVLFDTVCMADLEAAGRMMWKRASAAPLFAVGSSGVTAALIHAWREADVIAPQAGSQPGRRGAEGPLLVISGSCSAVTERQLRWAEARGYAMVEAEPARLLSGDADVAHRLTAQAVGALARRHNVVIYTAKGRASREGEAAVGGDVLGRALGDVLRSVLRHSAVRRVLLCGGDTSSHAVARLGLTALTWRAAVERGAPLCVAHAEGPLDGLEVVLKGGQVGSDAFFDAVRRA